MASVIAVRIAHPFLTKARIDRAFKDRAPIRQQPLQKSRYGRLLPLFFFAILSLVISGRFNPWLRYLFAVVTVCLATLLRLEFLGALGTRFSYIMFFPALTLATLVAGLGPGLFAIFLSALSAHLFFTEKVGSPEFPLSLNILATGVFIATGLLISILCEGMQRARRRAAAAEAAAQTAEYLRRHEQARQKSEANIHKRVEDALQRERDLLQTIMNGAHNSHLAFLDRDFNFIRVNETYARSAGFRAEEMIGKNHFDLYPHPENQEIFARVRDTGEPFEAHDKPFTYRHQPERGVTYWDWTLTPIRTQEGYTTGLVLSLFETTARKQAEDALKEADRQKDEFLAMLAHELRNPMAAISAAGRILSRSGADPERFQIARDALSKRIGQLARLVDDLLDISRISRGKIELKKQNLDLENVISQAAESARTYFEEKDQQLVVRIADPLPVFGDPIRLEQIIANLLTNAVRYSEKGQEITLSAFREGGEAVVRVKDEGIGIRKDLLSKLFEPFSQADKSLARTRGGLGLGLTIVKRLSELHGGFVSATSEGEGKGSVFEVRLPVGEAYSPTDARENRLVKVQALRILLVEDHADTALMQATMLELEGHTVMIAGDGPTAVEKAISLNPDVILLDIGLPGFDGFEVAKRVRQAGLIDIFIVALTGYGQERDIVKAREAGIDQHLLKPVDYEKLSDLLTNHSTKVCRPKEVTFDA